MFFSVSFLGYAVEFHFRGSKLRRRFSEFFSFFENSTKGTAKSRKIIFVRDHRWSAFVFAVKKALLYFINSLKENPSIAILHGGAVCKDGVIFCFLGKRGRGKSTSCEIFVRSGFKLISEDTLFLDVKKSEFITFPKPIVVKGRAREIRRVLVISPAKDRVKPKRVFTILLSRRIENYSEFRDFVRRMRKVASWGGNENIPYLEKISKSEGIEFLIKQMYNFKFVDKESFLRFISRWKFFKLV